MHNGNASASILTNVTFSNNVSGNLGGGMVNSNASASILTDVAFSTNSASAYGGGMYNWSASPALRNVTFSNNLAMDGGGLYNTVFSHAKLTNVTFSDNTATGEAGGMGNWSSSPSLTNVTFSGNSAGTDGGGILNRNTSNLTLTNVVFWGNTGTGPDVVNDTSTPFITYTCSQQDLTGFGSNNVTLGSDPLVVAAGGEVFLNQSSGCENAGLDSAADTAFAAEGLDWRDMTTASDGTLDTGTVDMGRHYDPVRVSITAFTADASELSWSTGSPVPVEYYCVITNDQDGTVIVIDAADLTSGAAAHGLTTDAVATMACYGIGMPALAEAIVLAP